MLLLDSGCTQSVIPLKLLRTLPDSCYTPITPTAGRGTLANGANIPLNGKSNLTFSIGGHKVTAPFWVADIDNHALLGLDFFQAHDSMIDFRTYQFYCDGKKFNCCAEDGSPLKAGVQVKRDTTIPPKSELLVAARLNHIWSQGTACIEATTDIPGLMVASSVHQPSDQDLCVRLMNYSEDKVTLPAGKKIAMCSAVEVLEPASQPMINKSLFQELESHVGG